MDKPAFELKLPPTDKYPDGKNTLATNGVVVIVGGNGSGKTRLGVWLEGTKPLKSHRISAQKSLTFPNTIHPVDPAQAERLLLIGNETASGPQHRDSFRWAGNPATSLLNDFQRLADYLFSEEHDVSVRFRQGLRIAATTPSQAETAPVIPTTKLDVIKRIWDEALPKRELLIGGGKVEARKRGSPDVYHAKELSDGERVIFYLIGEALSVPKDGLFIVDEPELHLHRALQSRLWDAIEAERPDCLFVHLTHDLDFAASRRGATTIWLREFSRNTWDWHVVPTLENVSEPMFLEILGSRKPILFVEGDKGSLDYFLYGKIYPNWTVIPCGSCYRVIQNTISFESLNDLHQNNCRGLIDADSRSPDAAEKLKARKVEVLPFAEIENILLIEPLVRLAARMLSLDGDEVFVNAKRCILEHLALHRDAVVSALTADELEQAFRSFDPQVTGKQELTRAFETVFEKVDPKTIYDKWDHEIGDVLQRQEYNGALRYYSNKGLHSIVAHLFKTPYQDFILRKLRSSEATEITNAIRAAVPQFQPV